MYLEVRTDFPPGHSRGEAAARVLERLRRERADFVVLNFHDAAYVPPECLRLLDSILDDDDTDVRIILTEASYEVRRTFVDDGLLCPTVLERDDDVSGALALQPR